MPKQIPTPGQAVDDLYAALGEYERTLLGMPTSERFFKLDAARKNFVSAIVSMAFAAVVEAERLKDPPRG